MARNPNPRTRDQAPIKATDTPACTESAHTTLRHPSEFKQSDDSCCHLATVGIQRIGEGRPLAADDVLGHPAIHAALNDLNGLVGCIMI